MLRKSTERKFIRSVISRVHPDLFEGHKEEQRVNTESLKELHKTVERLTEGQSADSVDLKFYYREKDVSNGTFQFASVRLTDSLVPLYEAFGVISQEEAEELRSHESHDARNLDDTNFLQWLEATIQEASVTARDLANRKEILNQLQSSITSEFGLKKIRVGCQHGQSLLSVSDVLEQIDSLKIVQEALRGDSECSERLKGLSMRVHCPRNAPVRDYHWVDYDSGQDHHISTRRWAEISSFGEVEVVAHTTGVAERLRSLDLGRARQLGAVDNFWRSRQDLLAKSVAEGLHVKFVWPDENCSSREFCLWAGRVLQDKVIKHELAECKFGFNLLVHSDDQAPSASFLPSSSTVQVHHHCSPRQLLELLLSNAAIAASNNTGRRIESATAEGELLQQARDALGARHVVRICGRDKGDRVSAALQRLVDNAATIRNAVNLSDVCLAIDDNFHLWDSGYVSIPYDFDVQTVVKEVTRLLAPVSHIARSNSNSPTSQKENVSASAANTQPVKNTVSEAPAPAEAVKHSVPKPTEQPKKQPEKQPKEQPEKQQEPVVVAKESEPEYESSDEDVARVYAEHSSAAEFIKSLRETDEESTGESVSGGGEAPVWPAPDSGTASKGEAPGSPVPAAAMNGVLVSHPIAPSPETSGNGELESEAAPVPHPAHVSMPAHLHSAAQKDEVELQPMFAAISNGGGGEESLRAWLEGQSDCDMAGSALIASPGNSAELFGSTAYSRAPANAVVPTASGGAPARTAIGPSVPAPATGTPSAAAGGSGNNGGSGRGRKAGSGTSSSRRAPSRGGRFAAVAGTLTALPKPTLPPFQAQWDMTPYGRVETPSKPPAFTTPVGPDAQEEDPSERAAAEHAQQIQELGDDSESSEEQGKKEKKVPQNSKAQVDSQQLKGDASKRSKAGDKGSPDAAAKAPQESTEELADADSNQDFHSHVNDLLKAVRFVKQRHTFKQNEGEGAANATAGPADAASPAADAAPASPEATAAPVGEAVPVAKARAVRVRRGSTAAAEAAAEAAALLLGSNNMARGQNGGAGGADRGRTQDRVASPVRASSVPQEQRNVRAAYKPNRQVFAPAETASNRAHPTSFVRRDPNPAVAHNKTTAPDRMKQLFGDRGPRTTVAHSPNANKRIYGAGARRPLHHLRRPTPAQQFNHVPSKASAITPSTNTLRRSRSVSRASSLTARPPSFEFEEVPSVAETSALSRWPEDSFTFGQARSRHSTTSPPPTPRVSQFDRSAGRGRAFTCQPPQQQWSSIVDRADMWPQPPQSSDQLSECLLARQQRMSANAGVQAREQSRGRAGNTRSLTPPPMRGTTEATAAAASRAGESCRSKSRAGHRGTSALPSGRGAGPISSGGGGMWVQDTSAGTWKLSAPAQVHRTQFQRSCSAVRGRAPGAVLR